MSISLVNIAVFIKACPFPWSINDWNFKGWNVMFKSGEGWVSILCLAMIIISLFSATYFKKLFNNEC